MVRSRRARLKFDTHSRPICRGTFDDLSAQGFRVLAVAYREVEMQPLMRWATKRI